MSRLTKAGGGAASGTSSANYRSNSANYRSQSHDAVVSPALAGGLATVDACRECVGVLVQYALEPESAGTAFVSLLMIVAACSRSLAPKDR